jgi:hypothetical protein
MARTTRTYSASHHHTGSERRKGILMSSARSKAVPQHGSAQQKHTQEYADRACTASVTDGVTAPLKPSCMSDMPIARRLRAHPEPAQPSKYIHHFDPYLLKHPSVAMVLFLRVSGPTQRDRCNLANYEEAMREMLNTLGVNVIGRVSSAKSGKLSDPKHRRNLAQAARIAKEYGRNSAILAFSTDRLLRSEAYTKTNQGAQPSPEEFRLLLELTDGITLLTLTDPDEWWRSVRGIQSSLGQKMKGKKGGRPPKKDTYRKEYAGYMKQLRLEKKPEVLKLHKEGESVRQIAKLTGIKKSCVHNWVTRED